ncbi:hypothetical protein ACDX41_26185, partial [Citrobacter meridianamericanus]
LLAAWSDRCRAGRYFPVMVCLGAVILGLLALRLEERGSAYAAIFEALLELGGERPDLGALRRDQAQVQREDSLEAIERAWEETPVSFT